MTKQAIVITTINHPTLAVRSIAERAPSFGAKVYLVGDRKSPPDFRQPGAVYLDLQSQLSSGFEMAKLAPVGHYARKNFGYLQAIRDGAEVIIETDDDNIPNEDFWSPRDARPSAKPVTQSGWVNVYSYFATNGIWPRGLPLDAIKSTLPDPQPSASIYCPIQQGLADGDPDVDAIYRLTRDLPHRFDKAPSVALRNAWCPFNSQNTTWWEDAFPLLYLPSYCSFRMTDVWRSFVAQRIAYANDWSILFHAATVFQDRNEHNLMRDFADELPGYLHNQKIRDILLGLSIRSGPQHIPAKMMACYDALVSEGMIAAEEVPLLNAWLADLGRQQRATSAKRA